MTTSLPVIIVSFNTCAYLRNCVGAVLASSGVSPRLIVVDNASQDGSAAMVRHEFPQAELIEAGANLGFAAGNNLALRYLGFEAPGDHAFPETVVLLNPDTEVRPDALSALVAFLKANPQAGAVGAQLLYSDGSYQHSAFRFPGIAQTWLDFFPMHPRIMHSALNGRYPRNDAPFAIDHPLGACIAARGDAVQQVGLLDADYFMYVEEVDWCRRMKAKGWQVWCEPHAVIVHHEAQATRQFREAMTIQLWRSRLQYFSKFERGPRLALIRAIVKLGAWIERRRALGNVHLNESERVARVRAFDQVSAMLNGQQ